MEKNCKTCRYENTSDGDYPCFYCDINGKDGFWQPKLPQATISKTETVDVRELLADHAHEAWRGWMKYMFSKAELNADETWTMPQWAVDRWQRQMNTKYDSLPEDEKQSDREEADKMLSIMSDFALSLKEEWQREAFDAGRKEVFKSTGDYSGHWGFEYSSFEGWNRDNSSRDGKEDK